MFGIIFKIKKLMIIIIEVIYIIFIFLNEGIIFLVIKLDIILKRDVINNIILIMNGDNLCFFFNSNGNNNKLVYNVILMINLIVIKWSNGLFVNNLILINGDFVFFIWVLNKNRKIIDNIKS